MIVMSRPTCLLIALLAAATLLLGCDAVVSVTCFTSGLNVSPASATLDHTALPPANSQLFVAFPQASSGCVAILSNLNTVNWTVSDTLHATIGTTPGASDYGRATCVSASPTPIAVTANLPTNLNSGHTATGAATLTCK